MHTVNLPGLLTSAHALVISQHIASRTHTLIGAEGVDTPEGTEQRVLGALVDVYSQKKRRESGWYRFISAPVLAVCDCVTGRPSQVIMGPGSKPSWQVHSKPPTTLVQVPFPQGFPMEHSSVSGKDRARCYN